jgi:phosphotransferase system HPr (HPr) family protein
LNVSRQVVVADPLGLHARPAAEFVERARTYACEITIENDGSVGNCKSLLSVLKLGIAHGTAVTINATGEDAENAVASLVALLKAGAPRPEPR